MTTSWKKKEEFSIFGKENYNKCSSSTKSTTSNAFTNFIKFLKFGANGIIYAVESPFIYTDRALTTALLNFLFVNTDCVKITDINTLAHIQYDEKALTGDPKVVEYKIAGTIADISSNLISIENERQT